MLKLSRLKSGEPEIFSSIQGEGVTVGLPSVFVRLSLCNLRCTWCDTKYTWDWEHHDPQAEIIGVDCKEAARRVRDGGAQNVVITGGEPLLQQGELVEFVAVLKAEGHRVEVETNGTIIPAPSLAAGVDQWNVSPKLRNSGNEPGRREVTQALTWFASQFNAYFKFVLVDPPDLDEVDALVAKYGIRRDGVLLMPEGVSREALNKQSLWIVEESRRRGYRFTSRLHILLWGDQRGR